jgi:hypothetical protein
MQGVHLQNINIPQWLSVPRICHEHTRCLINFQHQFNENRDKTKQVKPGSRFMVGLDHGSVGLDPGSHPPATFPLEAHIYSIVLCSHGKLARSRGSVREGLVIIEPKHRSQSHG